jgi:hypothetical protein
MALCLAATAAAPAAGPAMDVANERAGSGSTVREGGEDEATAVPILSIPFLGTGYTCDNIDDYDVMCPYTGMAPDVVYSYVPPRDMTVDLSLCASDYDTKLHVYESAVIPSNLIACNDDSSVCGPEPPEVYISFIGELALVSGQLYYIVVDGYMHSCGDYVLEISECEPECPPEAVEEGEGPCHDGYIDQFNGGCGSNPVIFSELGGSNEQIIICGESGNFDANMSRDTDWYMLHPNCLETTVTACITAEFDVMMGFIDFREGCDGVYGLDSFVQAEACQPACLTATLPLGHWIIWVSTDGWENVPCGSDYTLVLDGYELCTGINGADSRTIEASWGTIKGLYRQRARRRPPG